MFSSNLKRSINEFASVMLRKVPHSKIKDAEFALCNRACHFNAVAGLRAGRADSVWLVWVGHGDTGCVHVINSISGVFFDETWHDESNRHDIYLIRKVREDEFDDIYELLVDCKKVLIRMHAPLLARRRMLKHVHRYI